MTLKEITLLTNERLTYREREGGQQVLVLVHGNMTSSKHWDVLMDVLNAKYKIYAIDLRGFGGSTYNNRVTSIKDFSDDLKGFVEALELKDFNLIGWSTGGAVCMQFVIDNPGLCDKLVLLASASTRGYPFFGTTEDGSPDLANRFATIEEVEAAGQTLLIQGMYDSENRAGLKSVWDAVIYTHNKPNDEQYDQYVSDMLTQKNLADVYHSLNTFNISGHEGTNRAKDITIPVLILRGERDYVITEQMTNEIIEDLGDNASFTELKDTGHSPLVDDLAKLKEVVESFLA